MNTNHLSNWEQEEYLLNQRTPQMLRHMAECAACRDAIDRLDQTLGMFRTTAVAYSAQSLAGRPLPVFSSARRWLPVHMLRWSFAALLPLVLLALALLPLHLSTPKPVRTAAPISDDALLEQVDEQLSVAVPSSMESLTHLVSARNTGADSSGLDSAHARSKQIVESN